MSSYVLGDPPVSYRYGESSGKVNGLYLYKLGGRSGRSPAKFKHISQRRKRNQ